MEKDLGVTVDAHLSFEDHMNKSQDSKQYDGNDKKRFPIPGQDYVPTTIQRNGKKWNRIWRTSMVTIQDEGHRESRRSTEKSNKGITWNEGNGIRGQTQETKTTNTETPKN